jgi:hypothetical protein
MAVEGGGGHAQALGHLGHGNLGILQHGLGRSEVFGHEGRGPATQTATRSGRLEAGQGPFADDAAFELGERREDMEHQLAARRGGVDRLGERAQADAALAA